MDNQRENIDTEEKHSRRLKSVFSVSIATILSRILGLVRDMLFGSLFNRFSTDAFAVALTIPNVLRRFLAEGILSTAFIPVFTAHREKEPKKLPEIYGSVLSAFAILLIFIVAIGELFAPEIVFLFASGFSSDKFQLTVLLSRIMFPFSLLIGLSAFWTALLQTERHFLAPALGPVLLNIGIIISALTISDLFPEPYRISSMALGVLLGGLLQLLLLIWTAKRLLIQLSLRWNPKHPALREIAKLMLPTLFGLGIYQINILLSRTFASWLPTGSVTYIYYSDRLTELPLGVIAVAFATVNLPALSTAAERKDWNRYRSVFIDGLKSVLFICLAAAIFLFFTRELVISLLFQRGLFTASDVEKCAETFAPAAFGIVWIALLRNLTPAFYAIKDTKTPVLISGISLIFNAGLSLLLAFKLKFGPPGLTAANALSACLTVLLSFAAIKKKVPISLKLAGELNWLLALTASALTMIGTMSLLKNAISWRELRFLGKLLYTTIFGIAGGGIYLITAAISGQIKEVNAVIKIFKKLKR